MSTMLLHIESCLHELELRYPGSEVHVFLRQKGGATKEWRGELGVFLHTPSIEHFVTGCPSSHVEYTPDHKYGRVLRISGRCTPDKKVCSGPRCAGPEESPCLMIWLSRRGAETMLVG